MSDFWDDYKEGIAVVTIAITFIVGITYALLLGQANTYKYNCELDRRPNFHTSFFIASEQYAYDPKGFCDFLKEKMEKE